MKISVFVMNLLLVVVEQRCADWRAKPCACVSRVTSWTPIIAHSLAVSAIRVEASQCDHIHVEHGLRSISADILQAMQTGRLYPDGQAEFTLSPNYAKTTCLGPSGWFSDTINRSISWSVCLFASNLNRICVQGTSYGTTVSPAGWSDVTNPT